MTASKLGKQWGVKGAYSANADTTSISGTAASVVVSSSIETLVDDGGDDDRTGDDNGRAGEEGDGTGDGDRMGVSNADPTASFLSRRQCMHDRVAFQTPILLRLLLLSRRQ